MKRAIYTFFTFLVIACSSSSSSDTTTPADTFDAGAPPVDAATADTNEAGPSLDGGCSATFGDKLTDGFGRIDGIVYALQMPNDQTCAMPNRDHLIVQVLMNGAVYRMVVNTDVKVLTIDHSMPEPTFTEGWHTTGIALDYPSMLSVHSTDFQTTDAAGVVAAVTSVVHVGDPVSVYATSEMRPESAHLVHRQTNNVPNTDGAIVVRSKFILFAFADQTF